MTTITRQALLQLAAAEGGWHVSIYMPVHVAGEQNQQDPVRYKNLLREARERLRERGMAEEGADRFLLAANKLTDDANFWRTPAKGAAILVDAGGMRTWRTPTRCPELAIVGTAFHLTPLIVWLNENSPYFLLALSHNRVRLLRGNGGELVEVPTPGLPEHGIASLGYEELEEASRAHLASPRPTAKQGVAFHGHSGPSDAAGKELSAYLRVVDRVVHDVVEPTDLPLIFAGVDYLLPLYREVNTTTRLWPKHISGNPDYVSSQELCQRAREIAAEFHSSRAQAAVDRYWMNASGGRTEKRVEQVLRDAHAGLVETLFIDPDTQLWGRCDAVANELRLDDERRRDSEELLNAAAANVLRHGGAVTTATEGYVPGGGAIGAILRYVAEIPAGA